MPTVLPTPVPTLPATTGYWMDELPFSKGSDRVPPPGPSIDRRDSSGWLLQRGDLWLAGDRYPHGISMHAPSTVTVDLNRACTAYDAVAGLDDLTVAPGAVRFTVTGDDGQSLWSSPALRAGDQPVTVHVPLTGQHRIRLVVTPVDGWWTGGNIADWASAVVTC
ncbi:NPCBM/NEW2 domain-containing protein [Kitasatospora sp. LaBMicrA B282]|uniref:NPCBM/NEW2 domain-containing protein n=1 Tax=Kitasatospora sp. LaBMicrA B282 TaxID=3420949 RepID=UPI003D109030